LKILVLNSGSSSIKYRLFKMDSMAVLRAGVVDRIGEIGPSAVRDHGEGFGRVMADLSESGTVGDPTRVMGKMLRDVMKRNREARNFRVMGPDETASNRLDALFEATDRTWVAETLPGDDHLSPDGRVMEILSEHTCQGWLEGYLLTGRHGLFSCYEAFIHIVDSMFNQHAKWLKTTSTEIPWRRPIASLNYLLTSHVWRQDHNGFSHQDPGFIDRGTRTRGPRGVYQAGDPRQADRAPGVHHAPRGRHARGAGLDVAVLVQRLRGAYPRHGEP
jgi:hypothetical protein